MRKRSADGFTLIELLIIISILGILATIVVLGVVNAVDNTASASCKADFKTVELAQEAYRGQVGRSATSFTELETQQMGLNHAMVGPWLKEAPTNHSYTIGFNPVSDDIQVAAGGHGPSDGNASCAYA